MKKKIQYLNLLYRYERRQLKTKGKNARNFIWYAPNYWQDTEYYTRFIILIIIIAFGLLNKLFIFPFIGIQIAHNFSGQEEARHWFLLSACGLIMMTGISVVTGIIMSGYQRKDANNITLWSWTKAYFKN